MSKILASKDHEISNSNKSLRRLVILGGSVGVALLAGIVMLVLAK